VTAALTSEAVTALRLQLHDNGWSTVPVRTGTKKAAVSDWPSLANAPAAPALIEAWTHTLPEARSTGLVMGRQVAIDLDILSDPHLVAQVRHLAVTVFGPTPYERVGQAPKMVLLYRAARPIATQRLPAADDSGDKVEILGGGAQIVAYGIHPDTCRPYTWVGEASPLDGPPEWAPPVTEQQIEAFLDAVHAVMPLADASKEEAPGQKTRGGGRRRWTGGGCAIVRNAAGLAVDGREEFLRACVWRAAVQLDAEGVSPTAEAVATTAWALFTDPKTGADTHDGKWTERHALTKARGTVRRLRNGTVTLRGSLRIESGPSLGPDAAERPVEEAGKAFKAAWDAFLVEARAWLANPEGPPPVHAVRLDPGGGKSTLTAAGIVRAKIRAHYTVPRRDLGDQLTRKFPPDMARLLRGREAPDPTTLDVRDAKMCRKPEVVRDTLELRLPVTSTCCNGREPNGRKACCTHYNPPPDSRDEQCEYETTGARPRTRVRTGSATSARIRSGLLV
jgi:hypothetical protein